MKYKLMSDKEIQEEINFEDKCGVNTLLQHILSINKKSKIYMKINDSGENCGYIIE